MNVTAILNGIASYTQHKSLWRLIYHGRMKRVVAHRQRARSWKDEESRMELEARFSAIHTFLYPYTYSLSPWLFFPLFLFVFSPFECHQDVPHVNSSRFALLSEYERRRRHTLHLVSLQTYCKDSKGPTIERSKLHDRRFSQKPSDKLWRRRCYLLETQKFQYPEWGKVHTWIYIVSRTGCC